MEPATYYLVSIMYPIPYESGTLNSAPSIQILICLRNESIKYRFIVANACNW